MDYENWKKEHDMELAALKKAIHVLQLLHDAVAISSYPGGIADFGLRKKQPFDHWVAGEGAGSVYEPGMEDCGK
jgi:hypothetical protein